MENKNIIYELRVCRCLNGNTIHKIIDNIEICTNCNKVTAVKTL